MDIPRATYRLQFTPDFGFDAAAAIVPYLARLGISHVYCSPYLQAAPGSTHGYDVADPGVPNAELGGAEAHARFVEALKNHGLGQVLDIVPNHMTNKGQYNRWWWDLLAFGRWARSAVFFDLNWTPLDPKLHDKVLLPILGDHYGRILERGELRLERHGSRFQLRYAEHEMPLRPCSVSRIVSAAADRALTAPLTTIAAAIRAYPNEWDDVEALYAQAVDVEQRLDQLLQEDEDAGRLLDAVVAEINASSESLDALVYEQHYRLGFWRTGSREINYRRFFVENALVGVCVENDRVFGAMHGRVLEWVREGNVQGLRVDHIDGLRDPENYLARLREQAPDAWIVVEKILDAEERIPSSWSIQGTSGYDFLNAVNNLFVDPAGKEPITRFYEEFTGEPLAYDDLVREKKLLVLRQGLASEVYRLTLLLIRISEKHWRYRDYTVDEILDVLSEYLACFPVYRSYTRPGLAHVNDEDRRVIEEATVRATAHRPDVDPHLFEFIRDLLLLRTGGPLEADFVLRFQQLSGPAMAKGVEDTLFYTYNRFVSLNEVGGHPAKFGRDVSEFHAYCARMHGDWPLSMTATSTHDTKRSEDVRARLNVLSEIPDQWCDAVRRWSRMNERHRNNGSPSRNDEYLFYQAAVGAWPLGKDRAVEYMRKALREAKVHSDWVEPNAAYEEPALAFVESALADPEFTADLEAFVKPLIGPGRVNSLAQTLLKLVGPGVPDTYQGAELWDLSLVDPDNRRPVDYNERARLLGDLEGLTLDQVMARSDQGMPKLWLIRTALDLRRRKPDAFGASGGYTPLTARGEKTKHAVAFMRGHEAVAVVPRHTTALQGGWSDTSIPLPQGTWRNLFSGATHQGGSAAAESLLAGFPVALLERVGE